MADNKIQYILSWAEYGQLIDDLWRNLERALHEHNVHIDAIVIILREGVFTGIPLAYRLNIYKILPIQYKYMLYDGGNELKQVSFLPKVNFQLSPSPTLLLCDTFPAGGKTKYLVIDECKKVYPKAKFIFTSIIQDISTTSHSDILFSVHAVDVNDKWETTHPVYTTAGVTNVLYTALPWENVEEELAGANATKWDYA